MFLMLVLISLSGVCQVAPLFKVSGDSINGLTAAREVKMRETLLLFAKAMNDTSLQNQIGMFPYSYDVPDDPMRKLSPKQVEEKLFQAEENYHPGKDNVANIFWVIVMKKKPLKPHAAVGYGKPGDKIIYTYSWFFDNASESEIAGHIAHEWSHKVGFDHRYKPHPGRENTVPYAFGTLIQRYIKP